MYPKFKIFHGLVSVCAQSCLSLCYPLDCSLPGSSVHENFQARILEWVAISSSKGSSPPRDGTRISYVSCTAGRYFCSFRSKFIQEIFIVYFMKQEWEYSGEQDTKFPGFLEQAF